MASIYKAAKTGNLEAVMRLVEHDPSLVHKSDDLAGWTPLLHASYHNHAAIIAYLLDHEADIDHQARFGSTSLILASATGSLAAVGLLLERGADATITEIQGGSPLFFACGGGDVGVVRQLLTHQLPILLDGYDELGRTAMWVASERGNLEVVKMLLGAGADLTIADHRGRTPERIARERGHHHCGRLLQEWKRHYTITKARRLYDANYHIYSVATPLPSSHSGTTTTTTTTTTTRMIIRGQAKLLRVEAAPAYIKGRVEREEVLPYVEIGTADGVGSVMEYVVYSMKEEVFMELMELMADMDH